MFFEPPNSAAKSLAEPDARLDSERSRHLGQIRAGAGGSAATIRVVWSPVHRDRLTLPEQTRDFARQLEDARFGTIAADVERLTVALTE
jgi:hypothetical protein